MLHCRCCEEVLLTDSEVGSLTCVHCQINSPESDSASTDASEPASSPGSQPPTESQDTPSIGQKIVSRLQKFTEDLEASNTPTDYECEVSTSGGPRGSAMDGYRC